MKLKVLVVVFFGMNLKGVTLNLPQSLSPMAVYYQKAYQLNEFCCGYNALFNACNVEKACGFPMKFSDYSLFKRECMNYLKPRNLRPLKAVTNKTLDELAHTLRIKICNLIISASGSIHPIFSTDTTIEYNKGTRKGEINRMMQEAIVKREREMIKDLIHCFNASINCVVHFICTVIADGERHGILVSLVQNSTGRGLYIFDNMNKSITERSMITNYLKYLCKTFAVSYKIQFQGPLLPDRWPSTPYR